MSICCGLSMMGTEDLGFPYFLCKCCVENHDILLAVLVHPLLLPLRHCFIGNEKRERDFIDEHWMESDIEVNYTYPRVCCNSDFKTLLISRFWVYLNVDSTCLQCKQFFDFGRLSMTGLTSDIRCSSDVFVLQSKFG